MMVGKKEASVARKHWGGLYILHCVISIVSTVQGSTQVFPNARGITNVAKLATGPFAVRTVETPSVANTDIGQRALRQRQTVSATVNGGVPSPSLFQTADGRIFALSNGRNAHQFAPGQIFQSADGRFFTIAAVPSSPIQQPAVPQQPSVPVAAPSISNQPSSLSQNSVAENQVIDARMRDQSFKSRQPKTSSFKPTPAPITTRATSNSVPTSSSDNLVLPSTTTAPQVTETVAQPGSTSKSSLEVLTSFKNIFGKRTRPLTPASTLPLPVAQQRLTNQNAISSFDLHKIARKNKSIEEKALRNNEVQQLDARIQEEKQKAEIQRQQLIQQQLRLQLQRQELQIKRLKEMQLELQKIQESRQAELLQQQRERQEKLRMEQQKQIEELNRQQELQLKELQKQQEQEQQAQLARIRQQETFNGIETGNSVFPQSELIASAPLTPATSRFIALPAVPEKPRETPKAKSTPLTQVTTNVPIVQSEGRQGKSIQNSTNPKTQRVVTRIGSRRRLNRLRSRQKSPINLVATSPIASLPAKIRTATPTTTSSSTSVVSGYFTFPSTGVFYNF